MLLRLYDERSRQDSFVDYFWTWRYAHLPLLRLFDADIPSASVFHTVSTGYAGLLGAFSRLLHGAPLVLTEHGIYTNERRIEIEQARWIPEEKSDSPVITATVSPFKQMWISLFDYLSRATYLYSNQIITLFENNRMMQILGGADPGNSRIIPNGINLSRFPQKKDYRARRDTLEVGFVGRVVPIKDVKTFIRACNIVHKRFPNTHFPIVGPTDEDEEYFDECKTLVRMLGLEDSIEFTGRANVVDLYPRMDVIVLTSVSEAQPLVLLEANCCGVPCVASDVGACTELLNGRTPDDIDIGPSGIVTPIADPAATAEAIIRILADPPMQEQMGLAGIKRVERFYTEQDLNFAYLDLYQELIRRKPGLPATYV